MDGPQAAEWTLAMNEELKSLHENQTWQLVPRSPHLKIVPVRWVYKVKRDALGNIERFKARLVAKGYKQIKGIDYDEVYAPVNKQVTFRVLMAMVAEHDMLLKQLDIKTAFLYGQLQEEVYMEQPPGFEEGDNICKLKKAIYGLKQAPRAWHTRLVQELENIGFQTSDADPGLFIYRGCNGTIYLLVYVDDLLLATSKQGCCIRSFGDFTEYEYTEYTECVRFGSVVFGAVEEPRGARSWVGTLSHSFSPLRPLSFSYLSLQWEVRRLHTLL
jgi:histone deacetylase 1/2